MNKIELVQKIGDEVCEGCGSDVGCDSDADCGIEPSKCGRIEEALRILDDFLSNQATETDPE